MVVDDDSGVQRREHQRGRQRHRGSRVEKMLQLALESSTLADAEPITEAAAHVVNEQAIAPLATENATRDENDVGASDREGKQSTEENGERSDHERANCRFSLCDSEGSDVEDDATAAASSAAAAAMGIRLIEESETSDDDDDAGEDDKVPELITRKQLIPSPQKRDQLQPTPISSRFESVICSGCLKILQGR